MHEKTKLMIERKELAGMWMASNRKCRKCLRKPTKYAEEYSGHAASIGSNIIFSKGVLVGAYVGCKCINCLNCGGTHCRSCSSLSTTEIYKWEDSQ